MATATAGTLLAGSVLGGVLASGASAASTGHHGRLPAYLYAPYFETWTKDSVSQVAQQSGARYLTLAFLQTLKKGSCTLAWNGSKHQLVAPGGRYVAQIRQLRAAGGDVIPSFGGYSADEGGTEIADSCHSVSKIAQDMLALQFHLSYQMFTVRMRPFNHIGPGQNIRFAVSAFASQIAQIELGLAEPVVYVGDLSAERDFTDVRDIVRAYYLALERGEPGAAYNVCSGVAHKMSAVLDRLIALSAHPIKVAIDPARLRPVEIPCLVGDFSALRHQTGWQPQIAFDQTLQDVLTDWRQRLRTPQTDPQIP